MTKSNYIKTELKKFFNSIWIRYSIVLVLIILMVIAFLYYYQNNFGSLNLPIENLSIDFGSVAAFFGSIIIVIVFGIDREIRKKCGFSKGTPVFSFKISSIAVIYLL